MNEKTNVETDIQTEETYQRTNNTNTQENILKEQTIQIHKRTYSKNSCIALGKVVGVRMQYAGCISRREKTY
jgi:hypothetical protein